ncbi:MAG TPA: hypothetical protein VNU19_06410 [Candidatus Acidoferrum sp.]|nr:hypothetical protein [Candidatus Acidoferrum sp.]
MRPSSQDGERSGVASTGRFIEYEGAARHERADAPLESPGLKLSRPVVTRDFIGRSKGLPKQKETEGPEAFLVELPEKSRAGAHFHDCPEFQLFFPSEGAWYQRHALEGLVLHFADAYATYGPFGTDALPLEFFTLRPRHSSITGYMPWARDQLIEKGHRNTHVTLRPSRFSAFGIGESTTEQVLGLDPDGLGAKLILAGPGTEITIEAGDARSGGQYVCVVGGAVEHTSRSVRERALAWVAPGGDALTVRSSVGQGCALVVVQFPAPLDAPVTAK